MLEITCDRCKTKLTEPGALLFDPPHFDGRQDVSVKRHACIECFELIDALFRQTVEQAGCAPGKHVTPHLNCILR